MRRVPLNRLILATSVAMLVQINPAMSQQAPEAGQAKDHAAEPALTTRTYPVQDLALIIKDYPLAGSLMPPTRLTYGAIPTPTPGTPATAPSALMASSEMIEQLKSVIINTVDSPSWKDNGGDIGTMSTLDGQLVITQTAQNHAAIHDLLEELRRNRSHMVRVRADWVLLAPGELDKLMKNGPEDTAALPEISRGLVNGLPQDTIHYSGQIVCFSGQTVHLASGRARNVVTNSTPVVAPNSVGMDPGMDFIHYGVSLEINPTLSTDSATLDLSSVVSDCTTPVSPPSTQPSMPTVDRMDNLVQRFHTTVQVPVNKPVLIGGATADPATNQPSGKQMYLIIEADTGK